MSNLIKKHALKINQILVCLTILLGTSLGFASDDGFEVHSVSGQRLIYTAENQNLEIYDQKGNLIVSGEAVPKTTTVQKGNSTLFKHTFTTTTSKEKFIVSVFTIGNWSETGIQDTNRPAKAQWEKISHRQFLGHHLTYPIFFGEFSKSPSFDESFSATTKSGMGVYYNAVSGELTLSDPSKNLFSGARAAHYSRTYTRSQDHVIHRLTIPIGGRSYSVEITAKAKISNLQVENLIEATVLQEKYGVVLGERIPYEIPLNRINFNPEVYSVKACSAYL